jgi:T4-like virus Myoviridae tail sheath stabiliser
MRQPDKHMENKIYTQKKPFFYDAQIVRILQQLGSKVFGGYQVVTGTQRDGKVRFKNVPVLYGGWSRIVQQIFGGDGDNVIPTLPMMSYCIVSMERKAEMTQNPQNVRTDTVRIRARDPDGNFLVNQPGKFITVERMMPVPYQINVELSILTSNADQMFQLIGQICPAFNPDQEFQLSNSPLDWTSITRIFYEGGIIFEEIKEQGKSPDPILLCRLNFYVITLLSLPVKVYDSTLIHEIDIEIHELEDYGYFMFGENIDLPNMPLLDGLQIIATEESIIEHGNQ